MRYSKEDIAAILKKMRIDSGLTQKQAAEKIGRKQQTLASWETAQSQPDADTLFVLCDLYGVSIDEAFGFSAPPLVSPHAQRIGRAYDKAILPIKRVVDAALEPYMDDNGNSAPPRNDTETAAELAPDIVDFESHISDLPLYTQSIAAGLGNYLDSDDYEMVGFSNVPHRANIAVRISGDSMEPLYHDGDIVFVETDSVLDAGEIGIFNYDNQGYIKKLMFNPPRLVSLNKKYPDIYITEHSPCYTIGRVLGRDN